MKGRLHLWKKRLLFLFRSGLQKLDDITRKKKKGSKYLFWITGLVLCLCFVGGFMQKKSVRVTFINDHNEIKRLSKAETKKIWRRKPFSNKIVNKALSTDCGRGSKYLGSKVFVEAVSVKQMKRSLYVVLEKVSVSRYFRRTSIIFQNFKRLKSVNDLVSRKKMFWRIFETSLSRKQECMPEHQGKQQFGYKSHRIFSDGASIYMYFCSCPDSNFLETTVTSRLKQGFVQNWLVKFYSQNQSYWGNPIRARIGNSGKCIDMTFMQARQPPRQPTSVIAITKIDPHVVIELDALTGETAIISRTYSSLFGPRWGGKAIELGSDPILIHKIDLLKKSINLHHNVEILEKKEDWMLGTFMAKADSSEMLIYFYVFESQAPYSVKCRTRHGHAVLGSRRYYKLKSLNSEKGSLTAILSYKNRIFLYEISEQNMYDDLVCESSFHGEKVWSHRLLKNTSMRNIVLRNVYWKYTKEKDSTVFNPSIISLPKGSKYPFLSVGRVPQDIGTFIEKRKKIKETIVYSQIVYCFMDSNAMCIDHGPRRIDIPYSRRAVIKRMNNYFIGSTKKSKVGAYNIYVGPEDGRLFWDSTSFKLYLIYGMNAIKSTHSSRDMWVVNFENVVPEYRSIVNSSCSSHSGVDFSIPTELLPSIKNNAIEKNWMFFNTQKETFFSYEIEPHIVLAITGSGALQLVSNESSSSLYASIDRRRYRINQGTNSIPIHSHLIWGMKKGKIVNMQISHLTGIGDYTYYHLVSFFEAIPPFKVIKVLSFRYLDKILRVKHKAKRVLYISSIDILHKECSQKFHVADESDLLLLSYGIDDKRSGAAELSLGALISMTEEVKGFTS